MIKTNEWTVADLAKYLVSVQSTLTSEELDRLKMTAVFFKEMDQNGSAEGRRPNRYQAQQLYEPVDVFRQLGLPVLDWGKQTKWRSSSDEGTSPTIYHALPILPFVQQNSYFNWVYSGARLSPL
jgi:hypothetical protein